MEYLDLVDENNIETGEKELRSIVHSTGLWHRTVHIYLFKVLESKFYFLVHLRAKNKDLHPNCWDIRFGGHLKSGDSVESTVKSELSEEVGLELEIENLIEGEVYKADHNPNREYCYTFYYRFDKDITTLKFNDGEVQEIKWMETQEIVESMNSNQSIWAGSPDEVNKVLTVLKDKLTN